MPQNEGWKLVCIGCGRVAASERPDSRCKYCGDLLEISMVRKLTRFALFKKKGLGIWRFAAALPFSPGLTPVSLGEGGTPLIQLKNMASELQLDSLYAKNDGQNPT